jgi:hypothetical protein
MNAIEYLLARLYCFVRLKFNLEHMSLVESGPFSGMKLCAIGSWGGQGARLVGTYELELSSIIDSLQEFDITHVIDVGCADGYYTCGLAFKYPSVSVTAYDLSRRARWCTYSAARANNLLSKISIRNFFDVNEFEAKSDVRELLFLDCEGFEAEIITAKNIVRVKNVAILVECHDFIVPNITESISAILHDTHTLEYVQSRERTANDIPLWIEARDNLLSEMQEGRPCTMTWIWAIPKSWKTAV